MLSTLENSQRFNISMHINILEVLLFTKQNIHLFKNNNTNYILWNLRKEYNLKQVLHTYSSFYKWHLQYNARKLFNKLPKALKKEKLKTYTKKFTALLIKKYIMYLSDIF